jgi:kumamolisin
MEGLSREEFERLRGAHPKDLQAVVDYASSFGLSVVETSVSRRAAVVSGSVANVSHAFGVQLSDYTTENQSYRGRVGYIYVPAVLEGIIEGVFGLDLRSVGNRLVIKAAASGTLTPPQVGRLYNFPEGISANGQTIGILELRGGYKATTLKNYFDTLGSTFKAPSPIDVSVDGAVNQPAGPFFDPEVVGDICVASAVAQDATIAVYFAPQTQQGWVDALNRMVHPGPGDPTPSVISISWLLARGDDAVTLTGDGVTLDTVRAISSILLDATTLKSGPTILIASGDSGSQNGVPDGKAHVYYPQSDPCVTCCGGTEIRDVQGMSFQEGTWVRTPSDADATGGGISDFFDLPTYQTDADIPSSVNDGHTGRGIPDIAGNASPTSGYVMTVDGFTSAFGGTSAVAPLYAGLIAIINSNLGKSVGFLNPILYTLGKKGGVFRDIADGGSNGSPSSPGYTAGPGWDACTGWGSIDGTALLDALRGKVVSQESRTLTARARGNRINLSGPAWNGNHSQ